MCTRSEDHTEDPGFGASDNHFVTATNEKSVYSDLGLDEDLKDSRDRQDVRADEARLV